MQSFEEKLHACTHLYPSLLCFSKDPSRKLGVQGARVSLKKRPLSRGLRMCTYVCLHTWTLEKPDTFIMFNVIPESQ